MPPDSGQRRQQCQAGGDAPAAHPRAVGATAVTTAGQGTRGERGREGTGPGWVNQEPPAALNMKIAS